MRDNFQVRIAQSNFDIATLEVDRQRAGHYPTLDLVASFNQNYAGGGASTNIASNFSTDYRLGLIGVQLNLPIYQGGVVDSRVRQAIANQDASRQNLEGARRSAQLLAQTSFAGVTNGVAQVKALAAGAQVGAGVLRFQQARTRSGRAHQSRRAEPAAAGVPDALQPGAVVLQLHHQPAQAQAVRRARSATRTSSRSTAT